MRPEGGARSTPRLVAALGSAEDPRTWSGIPFHLLQSGQAEGLFDGAVDLSTVNLRVGVRRVAWNLARVVSGRGKGGFQYSDPFLQSLWRPHRSAAFASLIVNCFQVYPSFLTSDPSIRRWFFLDQTLTQLFDYYGQRDLVGQRIAADAVRREEIGYRTAEGVIVHSEWAKADVVDGYGVEADRVHVVVPGPSLDPAAIAGLGPKPPRASVSKQDPLRLVFVGKEWKRKGLDRLLRAVGLARRRGVPVALMVIGCERRSLPRDLQATDGVTWMGSIDKRAGEAHFVSILRSADVGCLLSRYEAGGIALREYHAVGLPVIGPDTGGATEHMIDEASVAVRPDARDEDVADVIEAVSDDRELGRLTDAAWRRRSEASWAAAIAAIRPLLATEQ